MSRSTRCCRRQKTPFATKQRGRARREGRDLSRTLVFWFRRKYSLPPGHPLLLRLTPQEIEADYWAHHYYDNPAAESAEDDDWDADELLRSIEDGSLDLSSEWEDVING